MLRLGLEIWEDRLAWGNGRLYIPGKLTYVFKSSSTLPLWKLLSREEAEGRAS